MTSGAGGSGVPSPVVESVEAHVESLAAADYTADALHEAAQLARLLHDQLVARRRTIVQDYRPIALRGAAAAEAVVEIDRQQRHRIEQLEDELAVIRARRAARRVRTSADLIVGLRSAA